MYKFILFFLLMTSGQRGHTQQPYTDSVAHIIDSLKDDPLDQKMYRFAEKEPQFPGNKSAWMDYVKGHLDQTVAEKNMAPAGIYRILVTFVVDKDGSLRDLMPESHNGFGMENEVLRVLRTSPRWVPAIQHGYRVHYSMRLPVSFVVGEK